MVPHRSDFEDLLLLTTLPAPYQPYILIPSNVSNAAISRSLSPSRLERPSQILHTMAGRRLQPRQTVSSSTTSIAQPTTTLALSTTFTPAASCASNKLTILPPPGYFIWANEPVPFNGTTVTNCYPPEFLTSYTSLPSGIDGTSVVPVMSPLVCPSNFCTQWVGDDNYIACCPS